MKITIEQGFKYGAKVWLLSVLLGSAIIAIFMGGFNGGIYIFLLCMFFSGLLSFLSFIILGSVTFFAAKFFKKPFELRILLSFLTILLWILAISFFGVQIFNYRSFSDLINSVDLMFMPYLFVAILGIWIFKIGTEEIQPTIESNYLDQNLK